MISADTLVVGIYLFFVIVVLLLLLIGYNKRKHASPYMEKGLYVFDMNDCETVVARSAEEALGFYTSLTEGWNDELQLEDITALDLDKESMYVDEYATELMSYRDVIKKERKKLTVPSIMSSTEY